MKMRELKSKNKGDGERRNEKAEMYDANVFLEERKQFPAAEKNAYFESASTGLVPSYVYEGTVKYQHDRYMLGGDSVWEDGKETFEMISESRKRLGKMLHCSGEDIAFGMNTSHIISLFTANVELPRNCNVIIPENAYSSLRFLWQARESDGVEIRYAKCRGGVPDPDEVISLMDENTLAVCCGYVDSVTGDRLAAAAIGRKCRENGTYFVLDCAQAMGVLGLNPGELHADVLASNNYKWMTGFCGTGIGYLSKRVRENIMPRCAGWMSIDDPLSDGGDLIFSSDCRRYDLGYPNVAGIYGAGQVAGRYCELGGENIEKYVLDLTEYLISGIRGLKTVNILSGMEPDRRSQILQISLSGRAEKVTTEFLRERGIMCEVGISAEKGKALRIGIHYYNDKKDIDKLLEALS